MQAGLHYSSQSMSYDSTAETRKHIDKVQDYLMDISSKLAGRRVRHDASKLVTPEKEAFDALGPPEVMAALEYGSEAYRDKLRDLGPALQHHYANNDHHPEHFKMWSCPLCKSIWSDADLANDKRDPHFCPSCVPNGSMYEAKLEPASGISGMSLLSLLEMLADWKAAGERHTTGNLKDSLIKNQTRFHIEPQLQAILENTSKELGWL